METYPQVLENVRMASPIRPEQIPGFPQALARAEEKLGRRGRILVRTSGTEPVIRIMVEGEDRRGDYRPGPGPVRPGPPGGCELILPRHPGHGPAGRLSRNFPACPKLWRHAVSCINHCSAEVNEF